jgi:Rne/Rng family ribonuclease
MGVGHKKFSAFSGNEAFFEADMAGFDGFDFGAGKNGFLHISDLHPQFFPKNKTVSEPVGRKQRHRDRPPIQECLRRGQEVIVQLTKDGIGTKGPSLTTYLSIPGRFLVMMPGMSGLEVCQKLRSNLPTAFIPILMLTGSVDEDSRTKGFLVGTDDYMGKPFSVPELHARVSRLLRRTYGI